MTLLTLFATSYGIGHFKYVLARVVLSAVVVLIVALMMLLRKRKLVRLASTMLVTLYGLIALTGMWLWGTNLAFALLTLTLVIMLTGILLGSAAAPLSAFAAIAGMVIVQLLGNLGFNPNANKADFFNLALGDGLAYSVFFITFGLVVWLFSSQIERSVAKAQAAETALTKEKELLEVKLEQRTKKLKLAQLQEMQQLYRFAELGQLSASLLHDLANHLTVLTLDMEDLHKQERTEAIDHAMQSIKQLDGLVEKVRAQIDGGTHIQNFNVIQKIQETIAQVRQRTALSGVGFRLVAPAVKEVCRAYGDPTRFCQIMAVLLTNAADASLGITSKSVLVKVRLVKEVIEVQIHDWGVGIDKKLVTRLFEPFFSSKETGMGIGLFIARQMTESHFKGSLRYDASSDHTIFILRIPQKR